MPAANSFMGNAFQTDTPTTIRIVDQLTVLCTHGFFFFIYQKITLRIIIALDWDEEMIFYENQKVITAKFNAH